MHARSGAFQLTPDKVDDGIRVFQDEHLPKFKAQDGYKGFTLLADRQAGRVLGISFWESESARDASSQVGQQARDEVQQRGEGQGDVELVSWDVVIDDTA